MPDGSGFTVTEASIAYSDDALALQFSARHDGELLYVPAWSAWLRWDGCRWRKDDVLHVFSLARALCRDEATRAKVEEEKAGKEIANRLTSASTVTAVERLARSDERHARRAADFDINPWALNTPSGVLDLRTGRLRPHRKDDLFTKVTTISPSRGRCKRWIRFLMEITHGDRAMVRYLKRFIGYTLTGIIDERAFAFMCGPGGNGKSVLLAIACPPCSVTTPPPQWLTCSPLAETISTRPTSPAYAALVWSPLPKRRRGGIGPSPGSSL